MLQFFKRNALGILLISGIVLAMCGSQPASANDRNSQYWSNQWNWYDGTYRPYYREHSRRTFNYGYNSGSNWSPGYDNGNWGGYQGQYGNPYQYQHPTQGHYDVYQIGPVQYGVWH